MFFGKNNFTTLPGDQDKEVAAQTANDIIKANGVVLYGRYLNDGTGINFTTERKKEDSHVLIGIGIKEMLEFDPADSYVQTASVSEESMLKAQERYIKQMERELRQMKGGEL